MGLLVWITVGVALAAVATAVGRRFDRRVGTTVLALSLAGAIVGGFIVDLVLKGDSVMNFRGPTLLGACVGAVVLLVAYGWTWRRSPDGHQRHHVGT